MTTGKHDETTFEALIEAHLLAHGYEHDTPDSYDLDAALLPRPLLDFLRDTQPQTWSKLQSTLGAQLESRLLTALNQALDKQGSLQLLRHGFDFYGKQLRLAYFEPGSQKNPAAWKLFEQNRLTLIRQLRYDPKAPGRELDLALFLNGIPIVTAELKNPLTGQHASHAKAQYRKDRDPKAPIFRWTKHATRALVHFAVDPDECWMTTQLKGKSTFFLPFNKGHAHGAGNPPAGDKHRSHYLWEQVWERRSLLELVARFLHLQIEKEEDPDSGKKTEKRTLIFPRYHQLDCVRRLLEASKANGAGHNYLIQHSAGSGKSNSIAWLAHRLANLHGKDDRPVYDAVIVLTDRRVLDQQLQDTIFQFEHQQGLVQKIDQSSQQLAEALAGGARIIISTIHKFGFIQQHIDALPERRYAVIVDEAHSSQSGEMAVNVKEMLSGHAVDAKLAAELESEQESAKEWQPADQLALRAALARGPQPNLSFFAFTATPKHKTLELFGHKDESGKPRPFHLYSMKQAIEEGFILDVLKGYTTYERYFALSKEIEADPELEKGRAAAALKRWVDLHPTNVAQKTELIVEHFRSCVKPLLGGRAKGMLVTASRLQAVHYKLAFDRYIREKGYRGIHTLVAFSGELRDDSLPGESYTESRMNNGISETQLPRHFASKAYQLLLVANKYQTGFDQPLLCAMYVDKRLDGIQAVQTLSRLNRKCAGKEHSFVLDFVNDRESILASFQDYFETTTIDESIDPQRLYELKGEIEGFQLWTGSEVDQFAKVFFALLPEQKLEDHARLNACLDPAVDRFKAIGEEAGHRIAAELPADATAEEKREACRGRLRAYCNIYSYLAQIVPFSDHRLEKLHAFVRMLLTKLPAPDAGDHWKPGDEVALQSLLIEKQSEGELALVSGEEGELRGPSETGTARVDAPHEKLSTIIELLNERFGTDFPDHCNKLLEGISDSLIADEDMQEKARNNDIQNFGIPFGKSFTNELAEHHSGNEDFVNKVFEDEQLRKALVEEMLQRVYEGIRGAPAATQAVGNAPLQPGTLPTLPLRRLSLSEARPYQNCVPALDLKVAAGGFSPAQISDPSIYEWVEVPDGFQASEELFVAQVIGESMNRVIPNGAWCLFRLQPSGSRQNKIVLAQHQDLSDPDLGGSYTVKRYRSEKVVSNDGSWQHSKVTLLPESKDASFEPIVLEGLAEGELRIVAELLRVLN
ncbi:MAG: restriction endonuclease subunit R [Planctomycetota bacterium]|nr:MAG: restriction endonuclease subunit R [Planctomycetota bacterium]